MKEKYKQDAEIYPPPVRINLAYEQIAYGFDNTFERLLNNKFLILNNDSTNDKYTSLKKACLGKEFLPFIAARAAITGLMVISGESDKLKILDAVTESFKLLEHASRASIESIEEFRQKHNPL